MKTLSSLILALSALSATPALAQSTNFADNRIVVRTADLDLSGATGQRTLDHRIANAIIEACGTASNIDPAGQNDVRNCRTQTEARVAADRERLVQLASQGKDIVLAAR
jgi:UrcA family protein